MAELKQRKKEVEEIKKGLTVSQPSEQEQISVDNVISSGSTLLDLEISGRRRRGGGIPSGILMEIFGPSGCGKTTVLGEICANVQAAGGFALIGDGERRMGPDFIKYMGIRITKDNLRYPNTVSDVKDLILGTPETGGNIIDVTGVDSTASLLSDMDLSNKDGDKRGSSRAKEFHQLCRLAKGEMAKKNRLVVFTNQIQDVQDAMMFGPKEKTPGGNAVPFFSSLRLRVGPAKDSKVKKTVKVGKYEVEKVVGVRSSVFVFKSSVDKPYGTADICIVFDYGIDDIRANLDYIKRMTGGTKYWAVDKEIQSLDDAIRHIEDNGFEGELKEATINLWEEIDANFRLERKPKERG